LNGLDLFSGIGGIGLALGKQVRTVTYCESDRYAQGVLLSRMRSGDIDTAPIWDDVRTLKAEMLPKIDIIFGGFPCQDISVAGNGAGLGGERSGLFFEILRLAKEIKPKFIFLENVPAIRTRGLNIVAESLARIGYDCRWDIVSAAEVGAPHLRKRWFLLAHANSVGLRKEQRTKHIQRPRSIQPDDNGKAQSLANSTGTGLPRRESGDGSRKNAEIQSRGKDNGRMLEPVGRGWWEIEPNVGRVANGVQMRVDRLRCLGNSVVPRQAQEAFMRLIGTPDETTK
jgi:DNA (cytosine-5)-methyltransferase 1